MFSDALGRMAHASDTLMIEPYIGQKLEIDGEEWEILGYVSWSDQYVEFQPVGRPVKIIRALTTVQPHLRDLIPNDTVVEES